MKRKHWAEYPISSAYTSKWRTACGFDMPAERLAGDAAEVTCKSCLRSRTVQRLLEDLPPEKP